MAPVITISAIVANTVITGLMFWLSGPIMRVLGNSGSKILSKIGDLLLAAIAIMMIRKGIFLIMQQFPSLVG